MNLDLTEKRAFVCGSTQGIGNAAAIELAMLGANVTLIARNEEKLKKVANQLDKSKGQKHDYICADFSFPEKLKNRVNSYIKDNGPVHILINNTGGPPAGPVETAKIDEFRAAFESHLICNHIMVQEVLEGMKKEAYGRIINIVSTSVKQPLNNLGVSNSIRGAVANWSKTLANEVGKHNITVNNVLPGATDTGRLKNIFDTKARKSGKTVQEVREQAEAGIPLRRVGKPEEVGNAIAFLASPAAAYISGINVPVDGGRTACL